jgi:hypothetical protein
VNLFTDVLKHAFSTRPSQPLRHQPIPDVKSDDVDRIIRRDFPDVPSDSVKTVPKRYEDSASGRRERPRVQLAALKLAKGDLDALRKHIDTAMQDYRDVLAPAEYPEYSKDAFRVRELPAREQQRIIDSDWKRYEDWLRR